MTFKRIALVEDDPKHIAKAADTAAVVPLRVLLVEDSEFDAELLLEELRRGGYDPTWERVDTATGLTAALERQPWDIVTCDWVMPGFSGLAALALLRERCAGLPVIIVSGQAGEEYAVTAMKAGAHDFIGKHKLSRLCPAIERELQEAQVHRGRRDAEEALSISEERFRLAMQGANDGLWDWNLKTGEVYYSPRWKSMLGYGEDELEPHVDTWKALTDPEGLKAALALVHDLVEGHEKKYEVEFRMRHKDGHYVDILSRGFTVHDERGEAVRIVGTHLDISERKRTEEALHRLNRELRAISLCNQALMRAVDERTLLNDICRIVCDQVGYRMAWVGYAENDDAKTIRPVAWAGAEDGYLQQARLTWADTERDRNPAVTAIRSGESVCVQDFTADPQAAPWRDGALQRGYRSGIALPLKEEGANAFGILNIYSINPNAFTPDEIRLLWGLSGDLTFGIVALRARAESKRLEAQKEQYFKFFMLSTDLMGIAYPFGCFRQVNPAFVQVTGYSESELVSKPFLEFVLPEDRQTTTDEMEQQVTTRPSLNFENRYLRKDGSVIFLSWTAYFDGKDGVTYATARDITERKLAEEERQSLHAQLEQRVRERTAQLEAANEELEAFSYSVSHDLRAPLRAVDGFSSILLDRYGPQFDAQGRHYLQRVREGTQHMAQLINDLLGLSRITHSAMHRQAVDLSTLAWMIAADLRKTLPVRQVEFVIADGVVVEGDPGLLRAALENLLGNAWKYTSKHSTARIEFGLSHQGGEPVYFVRDDGVGFDMAYVGKLFGVFQRLHGADEFEGSGIGLANVQRIIHRHGGRVWAEGAVEHGATFYFTIPANKNGAP